MKMGECKHIIGYIPSEDGCSIISYDWNPNDLIWAIDFCDESVLFSFCPKCGDKLPKWSDEDGKV